MKKVISLIDIISNKLEIIKYVLCKIKNNYKFLHLIILDIWAFKKSTKIFRLIKKDNYRDETIAIINYDDNFFLSN